MRDNEALAQQIADAVIMLAWDWEVGSEEMIALILTLLLEHDSNQTAQ